MKFVVVSLTLFMSLGLSALGRNFQWWRGTEIYDIYVSSFMDSDNDGIGDIKGLTSKLCYVKELGIKTIKLSTVFETAQLNTHREGVTNYTQINPVLGTMKDFEEFLLQASKNRIKVMLDLPINHCHITHEWFRKSQNAVKPYTNYFVWKRGNKVTVPPSPPNNWLDKNNETAWTYDDTRQKFYYHWYDALLPDLNLKNKEVKREIKKIMNFWLDKGVAGFNLLAAYAYVETHSSTSNDTLKNLQEDQPDTFRFLAQLRKFVDEFSDSRWDYNRIIMVEDRSTENTTLRYFGDQGSPLAHVVSNREFVNGINTTMTSEQLDRLIRPIISQIQRGRSLEWVTEYSNVTRLIRRFNNKEFANTVLTIIATLPGITRVYYGQEIGMTEPYPKIMDLVNPSVMTSNVHALPMQWDNSSNAGFTLKMEPYAMPNTDYWYVNVEQQRRDNLSQYHFFKNLLKLRKKEAIKYGDFKSYIVSSRLYAFTRSFRKGKTYLVIVNLSNESEIIGDLHSVFRNLPNTLRVVAASPNAIYKKGHNLNALSALALRPLSSIVTTFTETPTSNV